MRTQYDSHYQYGPTEWRRLGAVGKINNIVSLCSALPHDSIIEIGAGDGSIMQGLSELYFGQELYALEISPSAISIIEERKIPRLVECQVFDGYHVPFLDDRFNLAILSHVIEHVEHPRQLLCEAARVSKYVFVEVPLEDNLRLVDDLLDDAVGHINFYSPKTVRLLIQSCGLDVFKQIVTNPPKQVYQYQKASKGIVNYYIKQALLTILPSAATRIFTYHGALVGKRRDSIWRPDTGRASR